MQLVLNSADEALVYELGGSCVFGLDMNGLHGIGGNGGVVRNKWHHEVVEGMTVSGEIVGRGI